MDTIPIKIFMHNKLYKGIISIIEYFVILLAFYNVTIRYYIIKYI